MCRSTASFFYLFLVLATALGLPLSVLAQSGSDLVPPPSGTDLTSDTEESTTLGTDVTGSDFMPWPAKGESNTGKGEPSHPGLTFVLWTLSLASGVLGIITCFFLYRFVREMDKAQQLRLDSHWGGFGGGLGGWQISPALVHLVVALIFGSLAILLIFRLAEIVNPGDQDKKKESPAAVEGSATTGSATSRTSAAGNAQ